MGETKNEYLILIGKFEGKMGGLRVEGVLPKCIPNTEGANLWSGFQQFRQCRAVENSTGVRKSLRGKGYLDLVGCSAASIGSIRRFGTRYMSHTQGSTNVSIIPKF